MLLSILVIFYVIILLCFCYVTSLLYLRKKPILMKNEEKMNKNETLEYLRNAKASHVAWVQKAKMLIAGFAVAEDAIPVDSTQCAFGKWFYGDGQKLNLISNNPMECMDQVDRLHMRLHDIYINIYKIYYDVEDQSFLSRLMGKKKKITPDAKKLAKTYFEQIEEVSNTLLQELNRMERRVHAIPEAVFAQSI